jgi:hypothetical protein
MAGKYELAVVPTNINLYSNETYISYRGRRVTYSLAPDIEIIALHMVEECLGVFLLKEGHSRDSIIAS